MSAASVSCCFIRWTWSVTVGKDPPEASLFGGGQHPHHQREVAHHLLPQVGGAEIDRHQHADATATDAVLDVPQGDRDMQRCEQHVVDPRPVAEAVESLGLLEAQPDLMNPIARAVDTAMLRHPGRYRHEVTGLLQQEKDPPQPGVDVSGEQKTPEISRCREIDLGQGIRLAGIGSGDRAEEAQGAESVGGGVVDVEHHDVSLPVPGEAHTKGRTLGKRDAQALQFRPGRVQRRLVEAGDDREGIHVRLGHDLPLEAVGGGPGGSLATARHRMPGEGLPQGCAQSGLVDVAGNPDLQMDAPGLDRAVEHMDGFIDHIEGEPERKRIRSEPLGGGLHCFVSTRRVVELGLAQGKQQR